MKKVMFLLLVLAGSSAAIVLAQGNNDYITWRAKKTFEKEFPAAQYAQWQALKDDDMYTVRFVYNDQSLLAYISEEGTMVATVRSSNKESLPFMVNQTVDKKYKDFAISKVEEIITPGDVSYLFWVENENKSILLRVYSNGNIHEIRKEKRKAATHGYRG